MSSTLDKIVKYKKEELDSLKRKISLKDVQFKANDAKPAVDFLKNFDENHINIIAEVKKASPSAGIIRQDFNPVEISMIYEENGAKCLSILTDEHFFKGSPNYLIQIKQKVNLPCLRKDFTLSDYHIFEARGFNADAILLIVAILDDHQLKDYQSLANELGMKVLIEVHDQKELIRALKINPELIGVNNRNLHTFKTSLNTSLELIDKIPKSTTCISESGLYKHQDLKNLKEKGFKGFLIGEALMKEKNIGKKLKELIDECES